MNATERTPDQAGFQPAPEQLARAAALRRFNRLAVYTPLALGALVAAVLLFLLLWLAVAGNWFAMDTNQGEMRALLSGLADTLFVLFSLPWLLACPLLPLGLFAVLFKARRDGRAPLVALQQLFWRLEKLLLRVDRLAGRLGERATRLAIAGNARLQQLEAVISRITRSQRPDGPA